jgi:CBS-domain-containing membrane protein
MTHTPKIVGPKTDVRVLKAMFERYDFNAFPVVDEEQGLLGVVTKLDFLKMFRPDQRRWIPDLRALRTERAGDIMTRGVATVTPDDGVATAIDLMVQSRLRSLPVVERRGRREVLVGIVSQHDVLSSLMLEDNGHD